MKKCGEAFGKDHENVELFRWAPAKRPWKRGPMNTDHGPVLACFTLRDETDTARLAARLASILRPGDIIALDGGLGAGKSSLARAVIRHRLGNPTEEVPSPTFTLVQQYDDPAGWTIHHFDLYRLTDPDETLELDMEDAFAQGVSLVEWPDRLGPFLPAGALRLHLVMGEGETERVVTVHGQVEQWAHRLADMES